MDNRGIMNRIIELFIGILFKVFWQAKNFKVEVNREDVGKYVEAKIFGTEEEPEEIRMKRPFESWVKENNEMPMGNWVDKFIKEWGRGVEEDRFETQERTRVVERPRLVNRDGEWMMEGQYREEAVEALWDSWEEEKMDKTGLGIVLKIGNRGLNAIVKGMARAVIAGLDFRKTEEIIIGVGRKWIGRLTEAERREIENRVRNFVEDYQGWTLGGRYTYKPRQE